MIASPGQTKAALPPQSSTLEAIQTQTLVQAAGTVLQTCLFLCIFVQDQPILQLINSMATEADHSDSNDIADSESSNSWQTVSDYLANSESSDSWQTVSPPPPTPAKMKSSVKPSKSRRVTIHSPSEEDLHERYVDLGGRRPPTPYAFSRHSSADKDDRKADKLRKHDQPATSPSTAAETAANTAANSARPGIPGVAPYNAPVGTVPQLGANQPYTHGIPGQPSFHINSTTNFTPFPYSINHQGQIPQAPVGDGTNMDGYQNSWPNNTGLHFQPQVPDTSLGPMTHIYQPRFDNGCVAFPQTGIIVCQPSSFISVSTPPMIPLLTDPIQPFRPVTFAPQPLVVAPAVAPVLPTLIASAPVYTTLGYKGDDGVVAPRVIVVRRVSSRISFRLPNRAFCSRTRLPFGLSIVANPSLPHRVPKASRFPCKLALPPPPSCPSSRSSPTLRSR